MEDSELMNGPSHKKSRPESPLQQKRRKVVVRVPGTSANLGPGYDCLGLAVDIWNEITVERSDSFSFSISGIDSERISTEIDPKTGESSNLLVKVLRRAFDVGGESPMPPLKIHCRNNIPMSSGFGSSSAVIVGGLICGLALCGKELKVGHELTSEGGPNEELLQLANEIEGHPDNGRIALTRFSMGPTLIHATNIRAPPPTIGQSLRRFTAGSSFATELKVGHELTSEGGPNEELLQLANEIEGHPDNVAPAIYGGIQLCYGMEALAGDAFEPSMAGCVMSRRLPCPDGMRLVVFVPGAENRFGLGEDKTVAMRGLLSQKVSRADAVFNLQRTALLVDSLHRGDLSYLVTATQDKLHQPIRAEKAFPHLLPMVAAALGAGAHGCFLSGAGPTVMAICSGASGDIFAQKSDERQEQDVAQAMREAGERLPPEHKRWALGGHFFICSPTIRGAHVVCAEPGFSDSLQTFPSLDGSL
eukprot:CAMPEP_0172645888 /NCGR_PEP_ID=MMETSP1068-20121228/239958_1 /TAXON_ID=35684 /ORGANISM="Pseudopedinella elastica, Strain CCMP716" /LENGTH=474 /DNA_ID=CAMNT_0013460137 /DNA_START=232 /DNA_END=1655 /DNA_ORIENTATION=-